MATTRKVFILVFMLLMLTKAWGDEFGGWTLKECIDYALENNITIKTGKLSALSAKEDLEQAQNQLFPNLSFSTTHQGGYNPFGDSKAGTDKLSYMGDYGFNASWTVWDGNKNRNNIKLQKVTGEQTELNVEEQANSIQEEIVQLYVQILYVTEAVDVNAQLLEISRQNAQRGEEMYNVGLMSKADLSQLQAQVATDEYNLVNIQGTLEDYKLQMKYLLRLDYDYDFKVMVPLSSDEKALGEIPSVESVLIPALENRPEIRNALLAIEGSNLDIDIAKAGAGPQVSLSGSLGTNTMTGMGNSWANQIKNNFSGAIGATLSIPIFDNRSTKTSVNKAKIELQQSKLNAEDAKNSLALTIEGFWINATSNQQRFRSAQISVKSAEDSYELLCEQFRLGLKNIVELTSGKSTLLNAQQSRLESKYTTILYIELLEFYKGNEMNI